MKTISTDLAARLIDFAPTARARSMGFGESQLHGAVAAYNMLARNRIAYLADEVGMGKTFVALGVAGLVRHLNPKARIMVFAPRENIQRKWVKELRNFVHFNWRVEDNCVKSLHGTPVREPIVCSNFDALGRAVRINDHRDLFLRMTTLSIASRRAKSRKRCRKQILQHLPWIDRKLLSSSNPWTFRDAFGRALNALIPELDLLIIDEAHNLKHGFGPDVSNRNRILGLAMGHPDGADDERCHWYAHRPRRILLLSATPFEYDFQDLYNQLDVFGFAGKSLRDANGDDPIPLRRLRDRDAGDENKTELVKRMMIRRVAYLEIGGDRYSKNMYRREWRRGGYLNHDEPMKIEDHRQRLIVGLIQKKVAEVLGDRRFNNAFQIGMLSSFESFLESISKQTRRGAQSPNGSPNGEETEYEDESVFDGGQYQEATSTERQGIDTHSLEHVVASYRERFGRALPHPKLDATARALADSFETGEKALVFVRRVATVQELKNKLNETFDGWIRRRMDGALPELTGEINQLFARYRRARGGAEDDFADFREPDVEEDLRHVVADDPGGRDSFFAWFFRGGGPRGIVSGAAFQKNRLASLSSLYSTLFEDDYVSWLLGRPANVLQALGEATDLKGDQLRSRLRSLAYGFFKHRTKQASGYPRLYVFEGFQIAGLRLLANAGGPLAEQAKTLLHDRFETTGDRMGDPPAGFPQPDGYVGATTFFTELIKRPELRRAIWPDEHAGSDEFETRLRRREERRELISAMARLGASFIDLYLLFIEQRGTFASHDVDESDRRLAADFVSLLDRQRAEPGFHAFRELSAAAENFDLLMSVNFPEAREAPFTSLAESFGRTLQHQVPVGGMSGGVNKRLVRQFRMPGFPLVLVTTDVLQEGEDLHTFCRRVIHYGITWTPSAMEQRTGRIDRIGGLVQRRLDGRATPPEPHELIQVYLPHLEDTVEVLQVRRVLQRLNRFIRMVHEKVGRLHDGADVAQEVLRELEESPPITEPLESAFPVSEAWMRGELGAESVREPDVGRLEDYLESIWRDIVRNLGIDEVQLAGRRRYAGTAYLHADRVVSGRERRELKGVREQPFEIELRSQEMGDATLLRCVSPVGLIDLDDDKKLDKLYDLQQELRVAKVCARHDIKHKQHDITVEGDRLFHLEATQPDEVEDLILNTVIAADTIERQLLEKDAPSGEWHKRHLKREKPDAAD